MKLKTATLIALISVCVLVLTSLISVCIQLGSFGYSDGIVTWYKISGVLGFISWIGIANFFFSLYKNQK